MLRMKEAVTAHLAMLHAENLPVPAPASIPGYVAA